MIGTILWYILIGVIIGVVARLVVPGRNPMGAILTVLVGIAGAIVGGIVAAAFGGGKLVALIIAIVLAALAVVAMTGWRGGRGTRSRSGPM